MTESVETIYKNPAARHKSERIPNGIEAALIPLSTPGCKVVEYSVLPPDRETEREIVRAHLCSEIHSNLESTSNDTVTDEE